MKKRELGWEDKQGIQNTGIEGSQSNIVAGHRLVLKIWENYITEFYDRANRQENLEIETEEWWRRERLLYFAQGSGKSYEGYEG